MDQVTIKNSNLSLTVLNYGAVIQRLMVHDKNNQPVNIVVGLDSPDAYLDDQIALGAVVGRFAGRISGGGFSLEGRKYNLYHEDMVHLHGGESGFSKKLWHIDQVLEGETPSIVLSYTSPHLEEGYPGQLRAKVTYSLQDNALQIVHEATTDRPTVVNLTNHSYFRLDNYSTLQNHHLTLNCDSYLQTDQKILPTGKILNVADSVYDFREGRRITSASLDTPFIPIENSPLIAEVYSGISGIRMKVSSNQPAVVVYTPPDFPAICFETQNYPDAPNFNQFPSSVLMPGESYLNKSVFDFDLVI